MSFKADWENTDSSATCTVLASSKFPTGYDVLENVTRFAEVFGCHVEQTPTMPNTQNAQTLFAVASKLSMLRSILRQFSKEDVLCSRLSLIIEEVGELAEAFAEGNLKKALDAITDIEYVVVGTAPTLGLQQVLPESRYRTHSSNMSKTDENGNAIYDDAGKIVKGPNYKPVDLTDLVDGTWLSREEF